MFGCDLIELSVPCTLADRMSAPQIDLFVDYILPERLVFAPPKLPTVPKNSNRETIMRKTPQIIFAVPILLLAGAAFAFSTRGAPFGAAGPTLLKRTVAISTKRYLRYWPNPSAAEPKYNTWSWTPQVNFEILGPVPGGSQWIFEVATPDGRAWVSFKLPTQEAGDDELVKIKGPDLDENELEKKAITQTGLFPFKITLKNALAGTNETIFAGKFKVATYAPEQAIPEYKASRSFMSCRIGACRSGLSGMTPEWTRTFP